jgi:hypothetical protein
MKGLSYTFSLLGICFLGEVVESIMRGGDRGLRGEEGLKRVDIGKWLRSGKGGIGESGKYIEDKTLWGAKRAYC